MRPFRSHPNRHASVAAVTLVLFLQACMRWTPVPLEPALIPAAGPVRVTLRTGQQLIVKSPVIVADTLREASSERPGIPLSQIAALDVQKTDEAATAGAVVIGALGLGALMVIAVLKAFKAAID